MGTVHFVLVTSVVNNRSFSWLQAIAAQSNPFLAVMSIARRPRLLHTSAESEQCKNVLSSKPRIVLRGSWVSLMSLQAASRCTVFWQYLSMNCNSMVLSVHGINDIATFSCLHFIFRCCTDGKVVLHIEAGCGSCVVSQSNGKCPRDSCNFIEPLSSW